LRLFFDYTSHSRLNFSTRGELYANNHRKLVFAHRDGYIEKNIASILLSLPEGVELIPVLKNDAFGLGMAPVAKLCAEFSEISTMATAQIGEAVLLRRAGIEHEILVMGGCPDFLNPLVLEYGLTLAVGRPGLLTSLAYLSKAAGKRVKIEIKIETGLHRIGFMPGAELDEFIREVRRNFDDVEICGVFSHFADTKDRPRTVRQYDEFMKGVAQLRAAGLVLPRAHICSSAAYEDFREYSLDAVRIGRRLYMDAPGSGNGEIVEAASFRSYITNLRRLRKGDTLSYNREYFCDRDCLSATVGVGYGDGLNEALVKAKAPVLVRGMTARLMGCCMDQCQIDVTGIECEIGDEVTFFGRDSFGNLLSSQKIALIVGGNEGCGLTSALNSRVQRIYR